MKNEDQQFSLLESIEVHEFLYEKEDIVRPHASLWGDFNFSLNDPRQYRGQQIPLNS